MAGQVTYEKLDVLIIKFKTDPFHIQLQTKSLLLYMVWLMKM